MDPRDFADEPNAPWPVRRGGWILRLYENSLGLAFVLLFLVSWVGHALGGYVEFASDQVEHGLAKPVFADYLTSSRFWFESFQNWQSEFFSIAAMVWLAVYLRQRGSPESKAVARLSRRSRLKSIQRASLRLEGLLVFEADLLVARQDRGRIRGAQRELACRGFLPPRRAGPR